MCSINLNESVKFKLTDYGRRILKSNHESFWLSIGKLREHPFVPPKVDAEGYCSMQLYAFMREFGPHLTLGNPHIPVERLMIYLPEKDQSSMSESL